MKSPRSRGSLLAIAVLLLVASVAGVILWDQYKRSASRRHLQDGLRAAQLGDIGRASREFEVATQFDADNVDALYNLGLAYVAGERNQEAVGVYLRALRLRPNSAAVHLGLGNAYNRMGDRVRAIQEWKTALQLDERSVPPRINLAIAATMDGKPGIALRYLNEASKLEPDNAGVYYNRGALYAQLGEFDKAENEFQRARQLQPDLPYLLFNLARIYELRGEVALAIRTYRKAIRERPQEAPSHCRLGRLLLKDGPREEANRELARCQEGDRQETEAVGMTEFNPRPRTGGRPPQ